MRYCNFQATKISCFIFLFCIISFLASLTAFSQEAKPLGFYEANLGGKFLFAKNIDAPYIINEFTGFGFSGKLQGSIYRAFKKDTNTVKWRLGDYISGDIGFMSSISHFIPTYRFVVGFAAIYKISPHDDLGFFWDYLTFSNDDIVSWLSGSGLHIKYRHKKIMGELGVATRGERGISWSFPLFSDNLTPLQLHLGLRYLKDNKNWGIRAEIFPLEHYMISNETSERYLNLRFFYGIYF